MRRNKPGLADLKKLRQEAQPPDAPPPPAKRQSAARKRSPFMPPASPRPGPEPGSREPEGRAGLRAGGATAPASAAGSPTNGRSVSTDASTAQLSDTDRRLFRNAVRYVERIRDPGRVLLAPVPKAPPSILEERRQRAAGFHAEGPKKRPVAAKDKIRTEDNAGGKRLPRPLSDTYAPAGHDRDDSRYLKHGHGTDILRDLKRGKWPIGASLDLHGSNLEDARERFERFLHSCLTHDVKCVRIVHGKGYGSPNGDAVLKTTVRRWLTQVDEVIAYTECSEADGGSGAVQALLK